MSLKNTINYYYNVIFRFCAQRGTHCFYNDVYFFFSVNVFSGRKTGPIAKCSGTKKFGRWTQLVLYLKRFFFLIFNYILSRTPKIKNFSEALRRKTWSFQVCDHVFAQKECSDLHVEYPKNVKISALKFILFETFLDILISFLIICEKRLILFWRYEFSYLKHEST